MGPTINTLRYSVTVIFVAALSMSAQRAPVTVVEDESWLEHLHREFNQTSMGKTGRLGPAAPLPGEEEPRWQLALSPGFAPQAVRVSGADLYRFNCRGCHGEAGLGAPPEINSLINPVRATSVAAVMERMKKTGMDISSAEATKLAEESKAALLQRLRDGGVNMPAFHYLNRAEIAALVAYLNQLAGLPVAARTSQVTISEPPVRVGELIAKSTCHICHNAAGPNPGPQQLLEGAIPPLDSLTTRKNWPEFVRKVTAGAPIFMGTPPTFYRGRMPVFGYISQDEASYVYVYLSLYPPPSRSAVAATLDTPGPPGQGRLHSEYGGPISPGRRRDLSVALLKFAIFPAVLFLFLASLLIKSLAPAAELHRDPEPTVVRLRGRPRLKVHPPGGRQLRGHS